MDEVVLRPLCDLCPNRSPADRRVVIGVAITPVAESTGAGAPLSRPGLMVVDVCEVHAEAGTDAADLAAAGRPLSRRHTAPVVNHHGARVGRPATSGGHEAPRRMVPTPCPVAGCASVVRRNNIVKHLVELHGWKVPRQPKRCPDCGLRREAADKQSMQAHRASVHGYDYLAAVIEANR